MESLLQQSAEYDPCCFECFLQLMSCLQTTAWCKSDVCCKLIPTKDPFLPNMDCFRAVALPGTNTSACQYAQCFFLCSSTCEYMSIQIHTNKSDMYIYRQQAIYRNKYLKAQVQFAKHINDTEWPSVMVVVW